MRPGPNRASLKVSATSLLMVAALHNPVYAQDAARQPAEGNRSTDELEEVTVYATKSPTSTFDAPNIVETIDADSPQSVVSGDISDLLEFTPGVEAVNGPRRTAQTVSIRGFDDESIITLIDGRRQNFESVHDGRFFLDLSLLKSVEVVQGASSASYGGGGIGGVVAFETMTAADMLAPGKNFGSQVTYGLRTANHQRDASYAAYGRVGNFDLLGSFSYSDSGDIRQGDGEEIYSSDAVRSGLVKLGYTLYDYSTFTLQVQHFNDDYEEPRNSASRSSSYNLRTEKSAADTQISGKYEYENPNSPLLNTKVHIYTNKTQLDTTDLTGANTGRMQNRKLTTVGATLENQMRFVDRDDQRQFLTFGIEAYKDEQTATSSAAADRRRPGVPNANADFLGFFVQHEMMFKSAAGEFTLIPAVRSDSYKSSDDQGNSQDNDRLSPKVAFAYKPIEQVLLFGSWARAFRAPTMTELYPSGLHFRLPPPFPPNYHVPNPNLKPETVVTTEVGLGLDFRKIATPYDRLKFKAATFQSNGENFITAYADLRGGTTTNFNIPKAKINGWDGMITYSSRGFNGKVGYSYVHAINEDNGEYLGNNVPGTLVTDLSYTAQSIGSTFGWRHRKADDNDRVSGRDRPSDGYEVHDIYYRWQSNGSRNNRNGLTIDLGVENVGDTDYVKRFTALKEEGRSYVAKVSYRW